MLSISATSTAGKPSLFSFAAHKIIDKVGTDNAAEMRIDRDGNLMKLVGRVFGTGALVAMSLVACDGDKPVATMENPAEDSALALSVMSARGDTLTAAVENVIVNEPLPERLDLPGSPAPSAPPVARSTLPAPVQTTAAPIQAPAPPSPLPSVAPSPPPRVAAETPVAVPDRRAIEESPPAERPERAEPPRRIGSIVSGAVLALSTSAAVCNAMNVGHTFRAQTVQSIRGSNDLVIPAGAQATAEVVAVSKWGAGVGVRVRSVRYKGASYNVDSKVAYVLPEGDAACIPEGTTFEVKTR